MLTDSQTDGQTDRQTHTHKQLKSYTDGQTGMQANRQTDRHTHAHTHTQAGKETASQPASQTDRHTDPTKSSLTSAVVSSFSSYSRSFSLSCLIVTSATHKHTDLCKHNDHTPEARFHPPNPQHNVEQKDINTPFIYVQVEIVVSIPTTTKAVSSKQTCILGKWPYNYIDWR